MILGLLPRAEAQQRPNAFDYQMHAMLLGPPGAVSLVLDLTMLWSLAASGRVRRGLAVNTVIFSAIELAWSSMFLLAANANSRAIDPRVSGFGAGFGLASMGLAIYALTRPARDAPPIDDRPVRQPEDRAGNNVAPPPSNSPAATPGL